ncbi:MAG: hypothetical protein NE330_02765 [Lentisphaeraceae bacterium]|nr:hypothetical protein [Lentisphaeraceae bacterium]
MSPEYMNGNTSQIWMYERRIGNSDWIMEGIKYIETNEEGMYEDHTISKAFELHVQVNQLVILHHPNCLKHPEKFKQKVREQLEITYQKLLETY